MSSLSHNPYDPTHPTLSLEEQREAWWRGSDDRFVKPYTEDVSSGYGGRLLEGYNSRKLDDASWAKIAFHIAAGVPITKIADHYKLSRSTIWRALTNSHGLRRRVAEERALLRREADCRFVAMRELVVDTLYRAVHDGNLRATIWAAERLGLGMELLQQAEKPPRPGYARIPPSWFPTDAKAASILAEIDTPPGTDRPLPVPEESPPASSFVSTTPPHSSPSSPPPSPPSSPSSPSRRRPGPRGQAPDLTAADSDAAGTVPSRRPRAPACAGEAMENGEVEDMEPPTIPDPVPSLPPLYADPMGDADPLPDFPAELRRPPRPHRKVRASNRPIPLDEISRRLRFGGYSIRPRAATRMLAWILYDGLPLADGVDGAPGLTSVRWALRPRWLSWGDKPMDL